MSLTNLGSVVNIMWVGRGDIWSFHKIGNLHICIKQDMHMSVQIYEENAYNCNLVPHTNSMFHVIGELGVKEKSACLRHANLTWQGLSLRMDYKGTCYNDIGQSSQNLGTFVSSSFIV